MTETGRELRYRALFVAPTLLVMWLSVALLLADWLPNYERNSFILAAAVVGKVTLGMIAVGAIWLLSLLLLAWSRPWIVDFLDKKSTKPTT